MAVDGALLIRDAHVLALDDAGHEWPCADIVIDGGRIAALGPDAGGAVVRRRRPRDRRPRACSRCRA